MSKSILAKAAAIICGAATLCAISTTAFAEVKNDPTDGGAAAYGNELAADKTNIVADRVQVDISEIDPEKGFEIDYTVYIHNNDAGFAATGLQLFYDADLEVVMNGTRATTKKNPFFELGPAWSFNGEKTVIGLATNSTDDTFENGWYFTSKFIVPADASVGDKYDMTIAIDKWLDSKTKPIDYNIVNGWIEIVGDQPDETTTAPAETTTAPTETSASETSAQDSSTTASETTGDGSSTDSSTTTSGTTKPGASGSGSGTSSGSSSGVTTGDAGVGVAAAALLLAAGTAVVATKKKKD